MRAYFINLDKRPERRDAMQARLDALGIEHVRIAATTPADVTPAQRQRFCNPHAFRWQSEAELSCSLSHVAALEAFLRTPDQHAVILEDDVLLSPSFAGFLAAFEQRPPALDILRIETDQAPMRLAPEPVEMLEQFSIHRLFVAGGGSAAYIVSRHAAERIAGGEEILCNLTDQALFNPQAPLSRNLIVRQLIPALAIQEDRLPDADRLQLSDLEALRHERQRRDGQNFWRRSAYNFYDLVERDIVGAARKLWNSQVHGVTKRPVPFKAD